MGARYYIFLHFSLEDVVPNIFSSHGVPSCAADTASVKGRFCMIRRCWMSEISLIEALGHRAQSDTWKITLSVPQCCRENYLLPRRIGGNEYLQNVWYDEPFGDVDCGGRLSGRFCFLAI